jgi:phosphoglycerate dehydrogenase-like enzyme
MSQSQKIEVLITVPFAEPLLEQLRQISPRLQINLQAARRPEDLPDEVWERAEILYTDTCLPLPEEVPNLRWVQLHSAGIDYALKAPIMRKPGMIITHLSGAAAPQMAEYVIMMMLALGHKATDLFVNQQKGDWPRDRWDRFMPRELRGATIGIVGYGSIGREIARLLQPFNVTILATKRDVMHPGDAGYNIDGLGDPGGDLFRRLYPVQALASMLKECDYIVVCLPLTVATTNLIGEEIFRVLKPGAFLIDVGRGGIINQAALLSALQEHRLAGAALDVFTDEPLPPSSPFWKHPNVIVTPHISGDSPAYRERAVAMFAVNLEKYINSENLLNRFDPERDY